jgi:hypothetical protein
VDGESGIDPDLPRIFAQKPGADTVESSRPGQRIGDEANAAADNLSCDTFNAPYHFGCGATRKSHQQDPAGIGSVDHEMGDPMRQSIGLPGARAGDNEERWTWRSIQLLDAMLDGSSLFTIKELKIGDGHRSEPVCGRSRNQPVFLFRSQLLPMCLISAIRGSGMLNRDS